MKEYIVKKNHHGEKTVDAVDTLAVGNMLYRIPFIPPNQ